MAVLAFLIALLIPSAGDYPESSLAQNFGQYGLDVKNPTAEFIEDRRGQPAVLLTDSTGALVIVHREVKDRLGWTAGLWRINGIPYGFGADGTLDGGTYQERGVEVYAGESFPTVWVTERPYQLRLSVQDSTYWQSGDVWLGFDDCDPDSVTVIPARAQPDRPAPCKYLIRVEQQNPVTYAWEPQLEDIADTETFNHYTLAPGTYRVWGALRDSLGFLGHYVGPVRINAGDCPPDPLTADTIVPEELPSR